MALQNEAQLRAQSKQEIKRYIKRLAYEIKKARLERQLCVCEVAYATGLHESVIRRIETGGHTFNLCAIYPLVKFLGLLETRIFSAEVTEPTREEWNELEKMQRDFNAFRKSKGRIKPDEGK